MWYRSTPMDEIVLAPGAIWTSNLMQLDSVFSSSRAWLHNQPPGLFSVQ